jgi:hypothetical protein
MSRWRESYPSFFMATVNPPAQWVTDQALNPGAAVDYYVFNDSLTEAEPLSTVEEEEAATKSAAKSATKSVAKSAPASGI